MADDKSDKTPAMTVFEEPDPEAPVAFQRDIYAALSRPNFSTTFSSWEAAARAAVPLPHFNYVFGSASTGTTNAANLSAFERYRLRPSMLVNATNRDLSVELFGHKYASPLLAAPIGVQEILHADGEEATARACAAVKIPMILSTAATRSMEQVAKANGDDAHRWFQLYWPKAAAEELTASLLRRAKASGYQVLVVTLDTFMLGWRPIDLDAAYLPFIWGQGFENVFSDPVFTRMYEQMQAEDTRSAAEKVTEIWQILKRLGSVGSVAKVFSHASVMKKAQLAIEILSAGHYRQWSDLQILKKHWDGPIVLKGIQTLEDAHRAVEYGMDGIVVSNHGGRQLDGAIASLDALAEIGADEKIKNSGLTVLFDGGIRCGSDVLKAIALGANAVLLGRPYVYGLAMGGQQGVEHVLKCMLADTDSSLGNAGKKSLADLSRADLRVLQQPAKL